MVHKCQAVASAEGNITQIRYRLLFLPTNNATAWRPTEEIISQYLFCKGKEFAWAFPGLKPWEFNRFPDHDYRTTDDVCTINTITSSIFFSKLFHFSILLERMFFKTLAPFSSLSLFNLTIAVERRSGFYLKTDICSQIPVCSCYSVSRMLSASY